MSSSRIALLLCLVLLPAAGCESDPDAPPAARREVLFFASASLREALEEAGAAFERETGIRVVFNFAGANVLSRQIVAADGADLFLSASEQWMDEVEQAGRLVAGTRRDLLANSLVVVAHPASTFSLPEPCALQGLPFEYLALGDPEAVPAGRYARDWLASVDCGGWPLWDAVAERVAPAPDVRAALGLVLADPDLVGIVYRTDWMAFEDRTRLLHEVTDGPPIRYVLARVAGGDAPDDARRFLDYLTGTKAAEVFTRHGFTVLAPEAPAS